MSPAFVNLLPLAAIAAAAFLLAIWRYPVRGLYVAIFASAILLTPHLPVVREKLAACEIVMLLTWIAVLANWPAQGGRALPLAPEQKRVVLWGAAFIGTVLVSFVVGVVRERVRLAPTLVETANYVYGFLLFATIVHLVTSWNKWVRCLYAWCFATAVVCLVGAWSLLGSAPAWTRDDFTNRLSSTFKFANQLPGFCLPVLPVVLVVAAARTTRPYLSWACVALSGGIVVCVLATGSRTAFVMLCFVLAGVAYLATRPSRRAELRIWPLRAISVMLLGGFMVFVGSVVLRGDLDYRAGATPVYERPLRMFVEWTRESGPLDETRHAQLKLVWRTFALRPVLGVGPHNFPQVFHSHEVHNTYLGVLAEEGLLGLTALLLWLGSVFAASRRGMSVLPGSADRLIALGLLIGFAALLVYGIGIFGLRQRHMWILCGLLAALPRAARQRRLSQIRHRRRLRPVALPRATRNRIPAGVSS
jgi:O-antigen ligase